MPALNVELRQHVLYASDGTVANASLQQRERMSDGTWTAWAAVPTVVEYVAAEPQESAPPADSDVQVL